LDNTQRNNNAAFPRSESVQSIIGLSPSAVNLNKSASQSAIVNEFSWSADPSELDLDEIQEENGPYANIVMSESQIREAAESEELNRELAQLNPDNYASSSPQISQYLDKGLFEGVFGPYGNPDDSSARTKNPLLLILR
jgi:hypothetical protein